MQSFGQLWKIEFVCRDTQTGKRTCVVDYVTSPTPPTVESEQAFQDMFKTGRYIVESHFRVLPVTRIP